VRDRLSADTLRILNQLGLRARPRGHVSFGDLLSLLNRSNITLAAFRGIEMENITRGPGWRFLNVGRGLERCWHLVQLLRRLMISGKAENTSVLEMLLEVADSSMTYRSRYFTTLQPAPVLDLLVVDESNPRSLAFQLADLSEHLANLPQFKLQAGLSREQQLVLERLAYLRQADANTLWQSGTEHFQQLTIFLDAVADLVPAVSNAITHHYFSHAQTTQQLASLGTGHVP
jgi:uncharacterized alpha-E superfamily protein